MRSPGWQQCIRAESKLARAHPGPLATLTQPSLLVVAPQLFSGVLPRSHSWVLEPAVTSGAARSPGCPLQPTAVLAGSQGGACSPPGQPVPWPPPSPQSPSCQLPGTCLATPELSPAFVHTVRLRSPYLWHRSGALRWPPRCCPRCPWLQELSPRHAHRGLLSARLRGGSWGA